jgi:AraC-like DNA-binding protein
MSSILAERPLEVIPQLPSFARACRPFPRDVVDLVCVEEAAAEVRPRMHNRFSIVVIRTPTIVRLESTRSIIARENWILLIPPRHLYALRTPTGLVNGVRRSPLILQIGASHLGKLGQSKRPAVISDPQVGERLANLIGQLQRPVRLTDCETGVEPTIDHLAACGCAVEFARAGFAVETLSAIRDYLQSHLDEQVSTAALSRFSGLTESHLIRAFHREFGLPPHAYHMQLRLAQACEALASGLSVATVAYECGFADQSHLSRKFKQAYGLTPAAWANAVRPHHHADVYSSR